MTLSLPCLALASLLVFSPTINVPFAAGKEADSPALAQLAVARQTKRKAQKKSSEEKRKILEAAVVEYRKVLEQFGDESEACAEASFRVGEIKRSLGDSNAARAAFETTVRYGEKAPLFAARALNEMAHLSRRANDAGAALATYQRVLKEYPDQETQAVRALTWIGKVQYKRDNLDQAIETWLSIADRYPSQPIPAIRAADLAALAALDGGDAEQARQILDGTRRRFSSDNSEQPWWSPEVEKALGKMKAARRLEVPDTKDESQASG